ncbi:MAG: HAD family hydrolase [Methanobacteriota archaeon]
MGVRAVSFDLFGTILDLDVFDAEVRFVGQLAKRRGHSVEPRTAVESWLANSVRLRKASPKFITIRESLARGASVMFQDLGFRDDAEAWAGELLRFWAERPLFPDVLPALEAISARHRPALITNVDEAVLQQILTRRGLSARFSFALSSERCQCYKPSERIFRTAILQFGVPPSDIVHVGDSLEDDVEPAQKIGMKTVHVARPGAPPTASGAVADAVVRDLSDLPSLLSKL